MSVDTKIERSVLYEKPAAPGWLDKAAAEAVLKYFERIEEGHITVRLPDGTARGFGSEGSTPRAVLHVKSWTLFRKILFGADIGFGESYMDGDWETDDLTALLTVFTLNMNRTNERSQWTARVALLLGRIGHFLRRNTLLGSRRNISEHYDLSNDFFRLFLDDSMLYSCALYRKEEDTLAQAQQNKLDALIHKTRIEKEHHVLEIGSGWGAFAIEAVRRTGCRVTTITLSEEQLKVVCERVREAGLEDRIDARLCDYREIEGKYDRIVSIEMLEAVGHQYFGTFFRRCDELLKPDGLAVIQVITIPDNRYEAYRKSRDWIQKYIFPGATVPSLTALTSAMTASSALMVESLENIGIHYARTLREWRERFLERRDEVQRLGFDDRFVRMWEYYLCYCEAGFATRQLGDLHLVLTRPNNRDLPVYEN